MPASQRLYRLINIDQIWTHTDARTTTCTRIYSALRAMHCLWLLFWTLPLPPSHSYSHPLSIYVSIQSLNVNSISLANRMTNLSLNMDKRQSANKTIDRYAFVITMRRLSHQLFTVLQIEAHICWGCRGQPSLMNGWKSSQFRDFLCMDVAFIVRTVVITPVVINSVETCTKPENSGKS